MTSTFFLRKREEGRRQRRITLKKDHTGLLIYKIDLITSISMGFYEV